MYYLNFGDTQYQEAEFRHALHKKVLIELIFCQDVCFTPG